MRIPPSVIVMSLVTAVPFALAVRDTMKPHQKTLDEMTDEEREAQYQDELRREAEADAQREAQMTIKRVAVYKSFFGAKPAQLGSFFGTVHLGMDATDDAVARLNQGDHDLVPFIDMSDRDKLSYLRIPGDDHCDELHSAMVAAWQDSPDGVYLDPASHQRASYHDCVLMFDQYVEVNEWIDKKGDVPVSLAYVGMSADKVREQLGSRINNDDGEILQWSAAGVGRSSGPTRLTASVENGKVTHVSVSVMTDPATMDAIKARLAGLGLGKATTDPENPDTVTYKGKVPVMLMTSDDSLTVDLGN